MKQVRAPISAADVSVVEAELMRHAHLRYHRVVAGDGAIVIHAPDTSPDALLQHGLLRDQTIAKLIARTRYSPVMKFVQEGRAYVVYRMTYRGRGGWSWPLKSGTLAAMAKRFVSAIGTDEFFELL